MRFELLQLYRNYRNIEDMKIDSEYAMVLGHFDRVVVTNSNTADNALDNLYEHLFEKNRKLCADIQPMILFTYDKEEIKLPQNKFKAITFLQMKLPVGCETIKEFYSHIVKSINSVICKLQEDKKIGFVTASIYIPFSFMNTAVIFYADDLTDICTVVKNIVHCKMADFQYSILSLPDNPKSLLTIDKKINISLRFIWKDQTDIKEAIRLIENLAKKEFKGATVNHLLGNNDCLLHVPNDGYKIMSMILSRRGKFKDLMSMVENTRATISFPNDGVELIECVQGVELNRYVDMSDNTTIPKKERKLIKSLKILKDASPKLLQRDINDILYRVVEFGKFVDVVKKHAKKGIATPLYLSIKDPYELFLEMAEARVRKANSEQIDIVLDVIGNVMNEMSTFYENILHCNLGFIEERGFYNSIIGLASNVELAYNNYANRICQAILSKEEREKYHLDIRCSVTSDKEPLICTSDIFEETFTPQNEEKALVKVNIPISYVFKYDFVAKIIIHEIAHHVGARHRERRLETICECFASVIADPIIQYAVLNIINNKSEQDQDIISSFEKMESYESLHDSMVKDITRILKEAITRSIMSTCKKPYFMDNVIDSIYYTVNNFPNDDRLISDLTTVIADFQYEYYEKFEDYFLQNKDQISTDTNLLCELSALSIKSYNTEFVKYKLSYFFNYIITPENNGYKIVDPRSCYVYVAELNDFIDYFCNAVSEAYCDLMMITLFDMSFEEYMSLMAEYGKTTSKIMEDKDYLTWIRICIIANYMNVKLDVDNALPMRFSFFEDLKLYKIITPYFNGLSSELKDAYDRSRNDSLLANFIKNISDDSEEKQLNEIFNMYYGILFAKEGDKNGKQREN